MLWFRYPAQTMPLGIKGWVTAHIYGAPILDGIGQGTIHCKSYSVRASTCESTSVEVPLKNIPSNYKFVNAKIENASAEQELRAGANVIFEELCDTHIHRATNQPNCL